MTTNKLILDKVWELVGIDFVGPLPETERGNKYIITCTDLFSKWPVIFTTFGIPKAVLSDNGSEFCNKVRSTCIHLPVQGDQNTMITHRCDSIQMKVFVSS